MLIHSMFPLGIRANTSVPLDLRGVDDLRLSFYLWGYTTNIYI